MTYEHGGGPPPCWPTAALLAMSLSLHSSKGRALPSRHLGDVRGSNPVKYSRHHDKTTNVCLPLLGYEKKCCNYGEKIQTDLI